MSLSRCKLQTPANVKTMIISAASIRSSPGGHPSVVAAASNRSARDSPILQPVIHSRSLDTSFKTPEENLSLLGAAEAAKSRAVYVCAQLTAPANSALTQSLRRRCDLVAA